MSHQNRKWVFGAAVVVALAGLALVLPRVSTTVAYAVESARADVAASQLRSTGDLSTAFERVAEVIRPSVVSISSVKRLASNRLRHMPEPFQNSPFRDFFGEDFFEHFFNQRGEGDLVQRGLGTGVIVSDDGYILTNNHVVGGADEVSVRLSDDRTFPAKVVGTDPKTDLAVLKIDATGLHPAELGDSEALKVGEWVVAAGNPFGLTASITAGIVSAKGRANVGVADYEDFIQTDAAINPGNSGGPLLNLRGQVVGINTAIATRTGGYMGIGFAIPSKMARTIMDSLISDGRVVRGYLGVVIQDLNPGLASSFGYEGTDGVVVADVTPDSPADKAGIKAGDIITRFNGETVQNMQGLRSSVAATKPDTKVRLEVFRDGKTKTLTVKIGELETRLAAGGSKAAPMDLGMTVRTVTPEVARQPGVDGDLEGVVVTQVEPLSPAERAGLRVQDVITAVQGEHVANVTQFRRAMNKRDLSKGVRLTVRSGDTRHFVFIQTDKSK